MDQNPQPPPPKQQTQTELAEYVEKHQIYPMFSRMIHDMCLDRPTDTVDYMINWLEHGNLCRIILAGPPCSGKGTQCRAIAQELGCVFVSAGELLKAEAEKNTPQGKRIKKELEDKKANPGKLMPDDLVTPLVLAKLRTPECRTKGWILESFPRNRAQALTLLSEGLLPTHIFALNLPIAVILERTKLKGYDPVTGANLSPGSRAGPALRVQDRMPALEKRMEQYSITLRHLTQTFESHHMIHIDGDAPVSLITEHIRHILRRPFDVSGAPQRPMRIVLLGLPNSGITAQQRFLCDRFGLIPLEAAHIAQGAIREDPMLARKIKPFLDADIPLPDAEICPLLANRLRQSDCRRAGWVLTGFPQTEGQARFLQDDAMLRPSHILFLQVPEDELIKRSTERYYDPKTGAQFRIGEKDQRPPELVQRPSDRLELIRGRIQQAQQAMDEVRGYYRGEPGNAPFGHLGEMQDGAMLVVPAYHAEQTVFERLCKLVQDARLPSTFPKRNAEVRPTLDD